MTCWMSSSLSNSTTARNAVEASVATRAACRGSESHLPTRPPISASRNLASTMSGDMKFSRTKVPSPSPSWSFLRGMIAVCGILSPRGWRNRAVTANQSASAPIMPASAAAPTYPSQAGPPWAWPHRQARKITVAPTRKPNATAFIRRRLRSRSASVSGSAPANDSARDVPPRAGRATRLGSATTPPSSTYP